MLRKDGTVWLNLGSSYASGGTNPSQSPLLWRAPACGSGGKELQDSQAADRACRGSDDESPGVIQSHHADNAHSAQCGQQGEPQTLQKGHDNEPVDSGQAPPAASPPGAPVSTSSGFSSQPPDVSDPEATASACPLSNRSSSGDEHPFFDNSACTSDTSPKLRPLVVRTAGKESFFSACQRSDCKGIGRCGLCWCKLAIPSLNVKQKDLIDIPSLVALALQADGWYLRSRIPWLKRNSMPESVTDRPATAVEYVFLLTKSAKYFYDNEAVRVGLAKSTVNDNRMYAEDYENKRPERDYPGNAGQGSGLIKRKSDKQRGHSRRHAGFNDRWDLMEKKEQCANGRNRRNSDWFFESWQGLYEENDEPLALIINPAGFKGAHFATFPQKLVEPCILAGSSKGSVVLDPFMGAGTVAVVAEKLERSWIGIELSLEYIKMANQRIEKAQKTIREQGRQAILL